MKKPNLKCDYCGKEFYKPLSQVKSNKKVYCSNECRYLSNRKTDEIFYENGYAYILLTKGNETKKILFDIEYIEKIKLYKWHLHLRKKDMRYDVCSNKHGSHSNKRYFNMARYIMNVPKDLTIDHINRNTLDNRKNNLRIVPTHINNLNKSNNTSGCVGVVFNKERNKWQVTIRNKYIGRFSDFNEAVKARKQAEIDNNYHPQNKFW